ncbi:hypothetical protein ACJX0J_025883, partial [Zea mays]
MDYGDGERGWMGILHFLISIFKDKLHEHVMGPSCGRMMRIASLIFLSFTKKKLKQEGLRRKSRHFSLFIDMNRAQFGFLSIDSVTVTVADVRVFTTVPDGMFRNGLRNDMFSSMPLGNTDPVEELTFALPFFVLGPHATL